jgi:hypothetical protein
VRRKGTALHVVTNEEKPFHYAYVDVSLALIQQSIIAMMTGAVVVHFATNPSCLAKMAG